jgi:hypothetical protein
MWITFASSRTLSLAGSHGTATSIARITSAFSSSGFSS